MSLGHPVDVMECVVHSMSQGCMIHSYVMTYDVMECMT